MCGCVYVGVCVGVFPWDVSVWKSVRRVRSIHSTDHLHRILIVAMSRDIREVWVLVYLLLVKILCNRNQILQFDWLMFQCGNQSGE